MCRLDWVNIRIPLELHRKLKSEAKERKVPIYAIIQQYMDLANAERRRRRYQVFKRLFRETAISQGF